MESKIEDSISFYSFHDCCLYYEQLLEQRNELIKVAEMLLSKERERIEALKNSSPEKQQNLVRINHFRELFSMNLV